MDIQALIKHHEEKIARAQRELADLAKLVENRAAAGRIDQRDLLAFAQSAGAAERDEHASIETRAALLSLLRDNPIFKLGRELASECAFVAHDWEYELEWDTDGAPANADACEAFGRKVHKIEALAELLDAALPKAGSDRSDTSS